MSNSTDYVLGTAGHIDHGKSSLICALTGTDPDRLAEEKSRGITIELGFAQLELPDGTDMGVVDVPGHERFVRQMIAGSTGIDVALLCVAADDGIMPQTEEHLAVISLLNIPRLIVALTKCDLADEEWIDFVSEDIRKRLEDTPYAGAPIVPVSSVRGMGLDELKETIQRTVRDMGKKSDAGFMRMPLDRVFTIKGAGTVVTGTLWDGSVGVGDRLEVLPPGISVRVRSVQEHGSSAERALAGNRVALNLNGAGTDEIHPGDFLVEPSSVRPTDRFDGLFTYVKFAGNKRPLKSGCRVHVAHGTREVLGRLLLMDERAVLNPGEEALAQIRLEEPLAMRRGDHFIVRSYSPVRVTGGGTVLDAHPRRRTILKESDREFLEASRSDDLDGAIVALLEREALPLEGKAIALGVDGDAAAVGKKLRELSGKGAIVELGADGSGKEVYYGILSDVMRLTSAVERALLELHKADPQATGFSKEALRQKAIPKASEALFERLLQKAVGSGKVQVLGGEISHSTAGAASRAREESARQALLEIIQAAGVNALSAEEAVEAAGIDSFAAPRILRQLEDKGAFVKIDGFLFAPEALEALKTSVIERISQSPATAAELRDAMGVTRKYAIPVLEYLDAKGVTKRDGNLRELA